MSSWLFRARGGGSEASTTTNAAPRDVKEAKVLAEKLKGYHDLSKVLLLGGVSFLLLLNMLE
jgi:hypothetical protein